MEKNVSGTSEISISEGLPPLMIVPQWCRTVLIIFMVIVLITGLPGNIFVILIQIKTKVKTTTDWFVTYLAVSDIISLVINIPIYIVITADKWNTNTVAQIGCRFHFIIIGLTFVTQTIIVACNAVDRLWKSRSIHQIFTPKRAKYSGIIALAFSSAVGVILSFGFDNNSLGQCVFNPSNESNKFFLLISSFIMLICGLISSVVIIISYTRIILIIRARNLVVEPISNAPGNRIQNTAFSLRQESRFKRVLMNTKITFIVSFVFIITTIIPTIAIGIGSRIDFGQSITGSILLFLLTRVYLINNCANPIVYFSLNTAFRRKIAYIFQQTN